MSASSIRTISEADFPAAGSPRQQLGFALRYTALIPLEVPEQPWVFRLNDADLELVARLDAPDAAADPDGRESFIACGAALHHLKLALKHFGCLGRLEYFPDLAEPAMVARVHFGYARERDALEKLLFAALNEAGRARAAGGNTAISETMLAEISQAVASERGWLEFAQSESSRERLWTVSAAADQGLDEFAPARLSREPKAVSGIAPGLPQPLAAFGRRTLADIPTAPQVTPVSAAAAALLAVVKTKTDDKHGWVAAGQTLARAVLRAQALGLPWSCFNRVRHRAARAALRTEIGHKGFAQVILTFGRLLTRDGLRVAMPTTATATFR